MLLLDRDYIYFIQKGDGYYDDGVWVPSNVENRLKLRCNIQPVSGEELFQLPEGERKNVVYTVYIKPDRTFDNFTYAEYKGERYKILQGAVWNQGSLRHVQLYLTRLQDA